MKFTPVYSSDLTPSDFFLFSLPKVDLGGRQFATTADIKVYARKFFKQLDALQYAFGIYKLIHRCDKCLKPGVHGH